MYSFSFKWGLRTPLCFNNCHNTNFKGLSSPEITPNQEVCVEKLCVWKSCCRKVCCQILLLAIDHYVLHLSLRLISKFFLHCSCCRPGSFSSSGHHPLRRHFVWPTAASARPIDDSDPPCSTTPSRCTNNNFHHPLLRWKLFPDGWISDQQWCFSLEEVSTPRVATKGHQKDEEDDQRSCKARSSRYGLQSCETSHKKG